MRRKYHEKRISRAVNGHFNFDQSETFRAVIVENDGYLPTHITQRALDAEIASPVRATVNLVNAELLVGERYRDLGHLKGGRDGQGRTGNVESRRVLEYVVRRTGGNAVFSITISSEKGGVAHAKINL
ncbi:MAG: hypothetical protein ACE5IR_28645 [bacterium]